MKVVLLAAGRSQRMAPIADKNFLKFLGRPLIEHQLEMLSAHGFKEILIIGGRHNSAALRKSAGGKITVREQKDLSLGMAGAILTAASWIKKDPFLLVSANDVVDFSLYNAVREAVKTPESFLVAKKVSHYFPGGYLKTHRGVISEIVEKPGDGNEPSSLVNIVFHYHREPKPLIDALKKISSSRDDRYEKALQNLFDQKIHYRALPFSGFWQAIKYPWHVLTLMDYFLKMQPGRGRIGGKKAEIAKTATIRGDVYLENGVRVLDNAVIQGPAYIGKNTIIATGALVRGSHIGENCVIGFGSEIARSYLGDNVWTHTNYIGDSIVGSDVSFGSGTVVGNLRLDEQPPTLSINGDLISCGMPKLGIITGDHVRVGINSSFMPGVKIGGNSCVGPGIVVGQDVAENSFVTGEWTLKSRPNHAKITPRL